MKDPSEIIHYSSVINEDIYKSLRKKLRQYLESKNTWPGRLHFRKKRIGMLEKAIGTHERVLTLLVVS